MTANNWMITLLPLIAGCSGSAVVKVERPKEKHHILGTVQDGTKGELVLAMRFTGGGAGDTSYQLLGCPSSGTDCDFMGGIMTGDGVPPTITNVDGQAYLIISRSDTLWSFSNFTNYLRGGSGRRVNIAYR